MKSTVCLIILIFAFGAVVSPTLRSQDHKSAKFVGVKACVPCHKTEKAGKQADVWQKSSHAGAFATLTSEKAKAIAKEKGLTKPPSEAPECLPCHSVGVMVDATTAETSFDVKEGVQCESCHGAGSAYKSMAVMKDKAKSIAAGLREFKDEAAIEKHCRTCHNEKSPSFKEFKFKESWEKIKHPRPKKS